MSWNDPGYDSESKYKSWIVIARATNSCHSGVLINASSCTEMYFTSIVSL